MSLIVTVIGCAGARSCRCPETPIMANESKPDHAKHALSNLGPAAAEGVPLLATVEPVRAGQPLSAAGPFMTDGSTGTVGRPGVDDR